MLNFTKTINRLVIRTAQQKFRHNFLVEFYANKNFDFLMHELRTQKNFSLAFVAVQNIASLKPSHVIFKQPAPMNYANPNRIRD